AITRTVMFGGERLDAALVASLGERLDGVRLLNHYGPTEATVGCTAYRFDRGSVGGSRVAGSPVAGGEGGATRGGAGVSAETLPIGVPVWNSRAYVVDENLRPVQLGEEGELVLAGDCVAVGYLGGDDQDRARFCAETDIAGVGGPPGTRAYRTGDRCAVRDGQLHYLGRLDDQVKVRGHRIEIHEVQDLTSSVDGVTQAAATVSQAGLGGIELFVVPAEGAAEGLVPRVLSKLRGELPAAAVPERVWIVPNLVVNAHGKWDADATQALAEGVAREQGDGPKGERPKGENLDVGHPDGGEAEQGRGS
ncbi:MAG: AMP-binding protein, partial [Candidatus Dormibacteraceae bacterium]